VRLYKRGRVWWARYFDAASRKFRRRSTKLTDRGAAERVARDYELVGADPDGAARETATLAGALDDLKRENDARVIEKKMAPATAIFYERRARQLLRLVGEGVMPNRLALLRPRHIDALVDARRAEGWKAHTIAKDLITMRLALRLAKRRGKWKGDLEEFMPERFSANYQPVERWLPHAELWALLAELPPARAAWVAFAVATSANLSEAAKATAEDIVDRDMKPDNVHIRGTKRRTRDRRVPIVKDWQTRLLEAARSALPKAGPLFAPWTKMDRDVKRACEKAGIAPCSSNDIRRTFGTWMRADGVPPALIGDMMGHIDSRMAERVYARLDAEQVAKLVRGTVPPLYRLDTHASNPLDDNHQKEPANK
jgi:integrase